MDGLLTSFTTWIVGVLHKIFGGLLDLVHDLALWIFSGILDAVAAVVGAIPAPDFIQHGLDLGQLFSGFPPFMFYLFGKMQLGVGISILVSGIMFNLLRKLFTLGQW